MIGMQINIRLNTMTQKVKELSLKDLENIAKQISMPEYPRYLGNGLWQIAENCITGQKGYEEFIKTLKQI